MAPWDDCPWLEPYFLSPEAAGRYLGLSPATLKELRKTGYGPDYTQLGPCVVYSFEGLDRFAKSRRRKRSSDLGPEGI